MNHPDEFDKDQRQDLVDRLDRLIDQARKQSPSMTVSPRFNQRRSDRFSDAHPGWRRPEEEGGGLSLFDMVLVGLGLALFLRYLFGRKNKPE